MIIKNRLFFFDEKSDDFWWSSVEKATLLSLVLIRINGEACIPTSDRSVNCHIWNMTMAPWKWFCPRSRRNGSKKTWYYWGRPHWHFWKNTFSAPSTTSSKKNRPRQTPKNGPHTTKCSHNTTVSKKFATMTPRLPRSFSWRRLRFFLPPFSQVDWYVQEKRRWRSPVVYGTVRKML